MMVDYALISLFIIWSVLAQALIDSDEGDTPQIMPIDFMKILYTLGRYMPMHSQHKKKAYCMVISLNYHAGLCYPLASRHQSEIDIAYISDESILPSCRNRPSPPLVKDIADTPVLASSRKFHVIRRYHRKTRD